VLADEGCKEGVNFTRIAGIELGEKLKSIDAAMAHRHLVACKLIDCLPEQLDRVTLAADSYLPERHGGTCRDAAQRKQAGKALEERGPDVILGFQPVDRPQRRRSGRASLMVNNQRRDNQYQQDEQGEDRD
jgi:hypothetical protein